MGKYLKYFETEAEHASYKNGSDYVLPNVSYVEENDTVFYESEEEFTEDELLYYYDGTSVTYVINLTTLKVKKYGWRMDGIEEDANIDENGNVVVYVGGSVPGYHFSTRAMYWTSESVNDIPMNFEYTLYDTSSNVTLSGEFNEMVTFASNGYEPSQYIGMSKNDISALSPTLEIKSKISNKTHRIIFE